MTPMPEMPNTWATRDAPVLHSIVARWELDGDVQPEQIADDTGLDSKRVERSVEALRDAGYVAAEFYFSGSFHIASVSKAGRERAGAWPSPEGYADRLIEVVEQRLATASTPEERSRWEKVRDGFAGAGRDLAVDVMAQVIGGTATGRF